MEKNKNVIPAYLKNRLTDKQMTVYQLSQQTGISRDYLSRLFNSKINNPGIDKLQQIATVLDFELSELLPCRAQVQTSNTTICPSELGFYPGKIPFLQHQCIGRQLDLEICRQWISEKSAKIIGLSGFAGIGKTSFAIALVEIIQPQISQVIWLDAAHPLTLEKLRQGIWPERLLQQFQSQSLVIVIDQLEVMSPSPALTDLSSTVPNYVHPLLSLLKTQTCQSHLVLISRDKPLWLSLLEKHCPFIQTMKLKGLTTDIDQFLQQLGLDDADYWPELIQLYQGHPLALKLATVAIQTVFAGSVREFLKQETLFLGDLTHLLQEQVHQLSGPEKHLIYTLAGSSEPLAFEIIHEILDLEWRKSDLMQALTALISQSLVETVTSSDKVCYTLQPFIRQSLRHSLDTLQDL